jgi:homogentisate 1,2-dioxygenase
MTQKNKGSYSSAFGWAQGEYTLQPHVNIPKDSYEEEHGRRGFFGKASHLYHKHPPTGWTRIEGNLKPRAYYASRLEGGSNAQSEVLLENNDVKIGITKVKQTMKVFVRNGDADEVRFIHEGQGVCETEYGDLHFRRGDYIVLPRGVTYRFVLDSKVESTCTQLVIESFSEIELPEKGMLGRHALFDPMVMRIPCLPKSRDDSSKNSAGEYELHIKRENEWTKVFYPFNPIDMKGWKGDLSPWCINVEDIRPVVSPRFHLPPSVHTTFVAQNFVICSFLPRPLESEEGAMKVPFYHRNIDFDEVLFYHEGNFFSREGISAGAITFHPIGIHHGPHPNAEKNASDKTDTKEIAVMIDTRNPLKAAKTADSVEYKEYHMSWRADQTR